MILGVLLTAVSITATIEGGESYLAASAAQRAGKCGDAVALYEACVKKGGPLAPYAMVQEAACRAVSGDAEGALAGYQRLIKQRPKGPWVRMARANMALLLDDSLKRPQDAAPFFDSILSVEPALWWVQRQRMSAAAAFLDVPNRREKGYEVLKAIVETARTRVPRLEAARLLAGSPRVDHKLIAAEALTRSAEFDDAAKVLATVTAASLNTDDRRARWQYLKGRVLLGTGEVVKGQGLLEEVAQRYCKGPWAAPALDHLGRSLYRAHHPKEADAAFARLVQGYPKSEAAGDALWWMANTLADEGDLQGAIERHLRLAEQCPGHARGDDALFAGAGLRQRLGQIKEAVATFGRMASRYPDSTLAPEAMFQSGLLRERLRDAAGAKSDYARAASGPLGDYYVHRAVDRLSRFGDKKYRPARDLKLAPKDSVVRPLPQDPPPLDPVPSEWTNADWYQRLCFFSANGLDEAEWEALDLADTFRLADAKALDPQAGAFYQTLADAGLAATVTQLVEASGWGIEDGKPSGQRLRALYPRAYWGLVSAVASEVGLDPYLLLAVGRQESTFRPRITSSAGAVGVLQLMPGTASWLVKVEPGLTKEDAERLEDPKTNLTLGAAYLKRMLGQFDGNYVYAVAGYNAGPGNVKKWRKGKSARDPAAFVEDIPFTETRGYVKNVLGNYAAYYSLYPPPETR